MKIAAFVSVILKDFIEKEKFIMNGASYDERKENRFVYEKGLSFLYGPGVIGKMGGKARFSITRESGEVISIDILWGAELIKYSLYYDTDGSVKSLAESETFLEANPKIAEYLKQAS